MDTVACAPDWLNARIPLSLGDFECTPEQDAQLSAVAWHAKTDAAARDELLTMLAFKVARTYRAAYMRARQYTHRFVDSEVLGQEVWLVFFDVLDTWEGIYRTDDGPYGYSRYFLRVFPLRLRGRVAQVVLHGELARSWTSLNDDSHPMPEIPDRRVSVERQCVATATVAELARYLQPDDFDLLIRHHTHPDDVPALAQACGLTRSAYLSRIHRITRDARALARN